MHHVLQYFNLYSMYIQCVFNVYSMYIQWLFNIPIFNMFCNISMSIQCVFNVYLMCIQYTFNVHSMCIQCLTIHQIFGLCNLTYLLSYPKSRDAIASKNSLFKKETKLFFSDSILGTSGYKKKHETWQIWIIDELTAVVIQELKITLIWHLLFTCSINDRYWTYQKQKTWIKCVPFHNQNWVK